jgi:CHAT domain-containing protein
MATARGLALTMLLVAASVGWGGCRQAPETPPERVEELAKALGEYRPFPLRLTGGFRHTPCDAAAAPFCGPLPLDNPAVNRAMSQMDKAWRASGRHQGTLRGTGGESESIDHFDAVWRLMLPANTADTVRAVAALERMTAENAQDADLWNDLSVAYSAQSAVDDRNHGALRFQALGAAAEAVRRDRDHPEALFNLAVLLAEMGLRSAAVTLWDDFLEIEPDPDWRGEAAEHRAAAAAPRAIDGWSGQALEGAAEAGDLDEIQRWVDLSPIQARTHLQGALFPAWGEAYLAGDLQGAEAARGKLSALVPVLTDVFQDWEGWDNLELIEADPGDPEINRRRRALAEGLVGLAELKHLPSGCPAERFQKLEAAQGALAEAGSGSVAWSGWGLGVCLQFQRQLEEGCTLLEAALLGMDAQRYPIATGYLYRQWGLEENLRGNLGAATAAYLEARRLLEATGEKASIHGVEILYESLLQGLGLEREAWGRRYALLQDLGGLPNNLGRANLLGETAFFLEQAGFPAAALHYQEEVVAVLAGNPIPTAEANSLATQAVLRGAVGDPEGAAEDLRAADELIRTRVDEGRRERLLQYLRLTEAQLLLETDLDAAADTLAQAEPAIRDSGFMFPLVQALELAAEVHRRRGETGEREARLREALALQEGSLQDVEEPRERRTARASAWSQVRELVTLLVEDRGAHEAAFELADAARSRSLLEEIGAPPPPSGAELAAGVPPGTALVHYLVVESETYAWVLTRDGVTFFRLDVAQREAQSFEAQVKAALEAESPAPLPEAQALLAELHDRLLRPLASAIAGAERLVFVSLEGLEGIPFAALLDAETGRYLVENHTTSRAISASAALALADRQRERGPWQPRAALAVGDPAFSKDLYGFLRDLPEAAAEAAEAARRLGGGTVLLGGEATTTALLARLPEADLLHFAGHALAGAEPALLLSPDTGDSTGTLFAQQLEEIPMPNLRLAVLSACETSAAGGAADTTGLVRPFLVAGADTVVATLWKVEDGVTREFMGRLYANLEASPAAMPALAHTQRAILGATDSVSLHPSRWAAFVSYSGGP